MGWPFEPLSPLRYGVILADPPWHFRNWSETGERKNPVQHYSCMDIAEIEMLPVNQLAGKDCVLWLWATFPMLPNAIEIMQRWNFRYVTGGVWHKTTRTGKTAFGTGYVLRSCAEPFLIGACGNPPYISNSERNVIVAERREHSRKPDETYEVLERLCPMAFKVELFARSRRSGWDSWGNETEMFTDPPEAA